MAPRPEMVNAVALSDDFYRTLGMFHVACSALDLAVDFAICKYLGVPAPDAHLITAGMMFGRKGRLLADLIGHSDELSKESKAKLLGPLNAARGTRRDMITHSYLWSNQAAFKFFERNVSGEFKATEHFFTLEEFKNYVNMFTKNAADFQEALDVEPAELTNFAAAALSLNRRPTKSPGSPDDK